MMISELKILKFKTIAKSLISITASLLLVTVPKVVALDVTLCENAIPPWSINDDGNIAERSLLRIFTDRVFKEIEGVNVKYKLLPWKRCQNEITYGQVDGALLMSRTEERKKLYNFSDSFIHYDEGYLYSKKNHPNGIKIDTLEQLSVYTIGLLRGHIYPEISQLKSNGTLKHFTVETSEQNFKMLESGRIDIMIEGIMNAKYYIAEKKLNDKIGVVEASAFTKRYGMAYAFNKNSPINQYLTQINQVIKKLRNEEFHTELLARDYSKPKD